MDGVTVAKLYTRTGDAGTTGLLGPDRVPKDDIRVEAMGAVDELNAVLGMALAALKTGPLRDAVVKVQDDLFTVGAELAMPEGRSGAKVPRIGASHVARLEADMEGLAVGPVTEFILPRGSEGLARLHWARTVARRAERRAVALSRRDPVNPELLRYLNRLSSLLYTMAVWLQKRERRKAEHPTYGSR
jgi:cob(I)alamin adenosyltransferase